MAKGLRNAGLNAPQEGREPMAPHDHSEADYFEALKFDPREIDDPALHASRCTDRYNALVLILRSIFATLADNSKSNRSLKAAVYGILVVLMLDMGTTHLVPLLHPVMAAMLKGF